LTNLSTIDEETESLNDGGVDRASALDVFDISPRGGAARVSQ
jgi:hypothetical protein